ncbi:cytochrome P450 [Tistrella mobilis]|uniref:cytochrome P450 n=1 Tax=Tistrella mobilis TaxID=171437 RepID=UPI00355795CE
MMTFDPADPDFRRDPYPTYARLRGRTPVIMRPERGDVFVFGATAVREALQDPRLVMDGARDGRPGPSWDEMAAIPDPVRRHQGLLAKAQDFHGLWFANLDSPEHEAVARLFAPPFTATPVWEMADVIAQDVGHLLDELDLQAGRDGPIDLMEGFARRLPLRVMARILGLSGIVPGAADDLSRQAEDQLWAATRSMMAGLDLDADARRLALCRFGIIGLVEHVRPHLDRPVRPGLIATLALHCAEGRVSRDEALANLSILLFAGNETTRQLIGATLFHLLSRPETMAAVVADPASVAGAVAETLRFDPPVQYVVRRSREQMLLWNVDLPAGVRVRLVVGSAGRDPTAWPSGVVGGPDPEIFDPWRPQPPNLAFGRGIHHCLGMRLAQAEAVIAVREFLRRHPGARLADPGAVWRPSVRARDLTHLFISTGGRS